MPLDPDAIIIPCAGYGSFRSPANQLSTKIHTKVHHRRWTSLFTKNLAYWEQRLDADLFDYESVSWATGRLYENGED